MSSRRTIEAATAVAGLAMMMGAVLLAPESAEATRPKVLSTGLEWNAECHSSWNHECLPPVTTTTTQPPTTTTEVVTTTTEPPTTTTEPPTTTTEVVTTTSVDSGGPTTTVAATTTSLASEGPTTTGPNTTAVGDEGGDLPTTGAGTSPILLLGLLTMLGGLTIMAIGRRTA